MTNNELVEKNMLVEKKGLVEKNMLVVKHVLSKKKLVVCSRIVFRKNLFSKGFGLMCHKKIEDEAHIFIFKKKKKIALTMWFVFFPIDVLFLDEKKRIVEIKQNFKPFTNYYPKEEAMFVLELPEGTINKKKLKKGDIVSFDV
ncbi:MAG: DUF192 domain-containing protein [Candidatus Nanoarchaeia archaeon]